jgi:hypothetical protein
MINNGYGNGNGRNGRQDVDWARLIRQDPFNVEVLESLGYTPESIRKVNPITEALAKASEADLATMNTFTQNGIARWEKKFNRTTISKLSTLCQMIIYDRIGGPERDNKPKALRRHWYAWFKTRFAQPFARQLGDYKKIGGVIVYNDIAWSQRLSQVYAWMVDKGQYRENICPDCNGNDFYHWGKTESECYFCSWSGPLATVRVTYTDLWVEDASRMMARFEARLFEKAHIVVAVEKDSLFADFEAAAKSLGAHAIISGKGKSSKAAIEKLLRDYFYWTPGIRLDWDGIPMPPVFTPDTPMHVIHVSDHDYDGEAVIGPTFAEQVRRYTPHVLEARVGIKPEDLPDKGYDLAAQMYSVKMGNKGYQKWAAKNALFLVRCFDCNETTLTKGTADGRDWNSDWPNRCGSCGSEFLAIITTTGDDANIAYGLEVEAMRVADYRDLLVYTLMEILDFDHIVLRLREETIAEVFWAAEKVRDLALEGNDEYASLLKEYKRLENVKISFETAILASVTPIAEQQADMFEWEGDDPDRQEYVDHVVGLGWGPWRPFNRDNRTKLLIKFMEFGLEYLLDAWRQENPYSYE